MVGAAQNYYAVLGVSPRSSDAEIRIAFRRLARHYHPDVNPDPGAAERFRTVVGAYEVLSDPAQRAAYDAQRSRASGTSRARPRRAAGSATARASGGAVHTSPRWTRPPVRGLDRHSTLRVPPSLLDSGGEASLEHRQWQRCDRCAGLGRLAEEVPCAACGGQGFHEGRLSDPCKVCWTSGTTTVCPQCGGRGSLGRARHLEITIPKGAHHGQQLRLRGMGDAGPRGGLPGDLYVELAPALPGPVEAVVSSDLVQAALRRLEEWLDRFAPYAG